MQPKHLILLAAALLAVTGLLARATFGESDSDDERARSIGFLIERLDDPSFTSRQSAGKQLADMGPAAFDALAGAAEHGSRDASTRAIEIVAGHLESDDAKARLAARRALHQIAAGENLTAMRQAEAALAPPAPEAPAAQPPARAIPQPFAARPAFLPPFRMPRFGMPPADFAGGHFRRVVRNNINGVMHIQVEENGQSVTIHEDPSGSVTVEWTEKDGDATGAKKFAANSIEQLKERSPEGYELYERYTRDVDAAPDRPERAIAPPALGHNDHFDRVEQHLDEMIERFRQRAADNGVHANHFDRIIETLERQKKRHHEQRQHFEQMRAAIAPPW